MKSLYLIQRKKLNIQDVCIVETNVRDVVKKALFSSEVGSRNQKMHLFEEVYEEDAFVETTQNNM